MIEKLTEEQKEVIERLGDMFYTVSNVEKLLCQEGDLTQLVKSGELAHYCSCLGFLSAVNNIIVLEREQKRKVL